MNWWRKFCLGALFWIGIATASKAKHVNVENEVLQSIMPPNGKVLEAFLIPRFPTSPTIEVVREFIRGYFAEHLPDWHSEVDTFTDGTPIGKIRFQNLVFTQNVHAKEKIVLAAHYDSKYSLNEKEGALPDGFIGATDSAWPCALLLYLARIIDLNKQKGNTNNKDETFQIIFFDGEESIRFWNANDSLYGSRRLASMWKENTVAPQGVPDAPPFTLESISLFVLFDLLGSKDTSIKALTAATLTHYQSLLDIYSRLVSGKSIAPYEYFKPIPPRLAGSNLQSFIQDDHTPFVRLGLKNILHLISMPFPSVWHTLADNKYALDQQTCRDLALIFKEFVLQLYKQN